LIEGLMKLQEKVNQESSMADLLVKTEDDAPEVEKEVAAEV